MNFSEQFLIRSFGGFTAKFYTIIDKKFIGVNQVRGIISHILYFKKCIQNFVMKKIIFILLSFWIVYVTCIPPKYLSIEKGLHVRVGLLENQDSIYFSTNGKLRVHNPEGAQIGELEAGRWKVQITRSQPARKVFRLLVLTTKEEKKASAKTEDLVYSGLKAHYKAFGRKIFFNGQFIVDNQIFRVYLDEIFSSRNEAQKFQNRIKNTVTSEIIEDFHGSSDGTLWLMDLNTLATFNFMHSIRLTGNPVTLEAQKAGQGHHFQSNTARQYDGIFELKINNQGKLTIINELPMEKYLKGVVPAEMPSSYPLEALKAQAIAARTVMLKKMGVAHQFEEFDVCDEDHCQVYGGMSAETAQTNKAVAATHGLLLKYQDELCNTVFSAVCGGHTENSAQVWNGEEIPYLQGVVDQELQSYKTLGPFFESESFVRKWIEGNPAAFCNQVDASIPALADGSAKYFRWQIGYPASELSAIVKDKTGQNLGTIKSIEPIKRGVSGRLTAIQIVGTRQKIRIEGELKIRQALSSSTLYSSCFIVDKTSDGKFLIKGAGFGHGVGMCQYGAAGMALKGKKAEEILFHYYPGTRLDRFY